MWVLLEYHVKDYGIEETHTSTKIHLVADTADECMQRLRELARSRNHQFFHVGDYSGDGYLFERRMKIKFFCTTTMERKYEYFRIEEHPINKCLFT